MFPGEDGREGLNSLCFEQCGRVVRAECLADAESACPGAPERIQMGSGGERFPQVAGQSPYIGALAAGNPYVSMGQVQGTVVRDVDSQVPGIGFVPGCFS